MKFALYTFSLSPHQLPFFNEVMERLRTDTCRYVAIRQPMTERTSMGWGGASNAEWLIEEMDDRSKAHEALVAAEILMSGIRDISLFEERCKHGRISIYISERWFKPRIGILRLLNLKYLTMAWRFVKLLRNDPNMRYFPTGIYAARDMARLCGLFAGDLRCLFRPPKLDFEHKPCGNIWLTNGSRNKRYCLDKMQMWGYFVEKSECEGCPIARDAQKTSINVLWVGRLLNWKRVDTIIQAVGELSKRQNIVLDIYGTGREENHLKKMASKYGDTIKFYPPVPINRIRKLMREHDVYVLSSNGYEGWGAVVSEALEEGMKVIGTFEAGSSATILPETNLFHAGDWKGLARLFEKDMRQVDIGLWTARNAAKAFIEKII